MFNNIVHSRQNVGDKVHIREGKSPEYKLKTFIYFLSISEVGWFDCEISGGRTGSSHPIMSA
jgi:hypothetical protein